MKMYLSYGGGINSVAMHLLLTNEGYEFESIFIDHECDWPETYEYTKMFKKWLKENGYKNNIKIIKPKFHVRTIRGKKTSKIYNNIYEYAWDFHILPSRSTRWCTQNFKVEPLHDYFQKPCFNCIGFAADESHRANLYTRDGETLRFPLIEHEFTRRKCKEYIKEHGLPIPMKSGCWFCPFQRIDEYRLLYRKHPDLFYKAVALEQRNIMHNKNNNNKIYYLKGNRELLDMDVKKPVLRVAGQKHIRAVAKQRIAEKRKCRNKRKIIFEKEKAPCYCFH